MNIEARKLEFIQEFLKIQSEDAIIRLEKMLKKERNASIEPLMVPMSETELNVRIDNAESDFRNNRVKTSSELLAKYK